MMSIFEIVVLLVAMGVGIMIAVSLIKIDETLWEIYDEVKKKIIEKNDKEEWERKQ